MNISRMRKQCVPGLSSGGGAWDEVTVEKDGPESESHFFTSVCPICLHSNEI